MEAYVHPLLIAPMRLMSKDISASTLVVDLDGETNDSDGAQHESLCGREAQRLLYPKQACWHLKYTAPLPLASAIMACAMGFYGMTAMMCFLGISSICWWWWPYVGNVWRLVDVATVLCSIVYMFSVAVRMHEPFSHAFLTIMVLVCCVLVINETHMYYRLPMASRKEKLCIYFCNLWTHAIFAHILTQLGLSGVMFSYCAVGNSPIRV